MPGLLPQPDFERLVAGLKEVVTQVERVPNLPPVNNNHHEIMDALMAMTAKIDNLTVKIGDLTIRVDDLGGKVDELQTIQARLPMQLKNAGAGRSAPLRGLHGLLSAPAPRTREELMGFTIASCTAAAAYFGLPTLQNATVLVRRQQIADYLGVTLD